MAVNCNPTTSEQKTEHPVHRWLVDCRYLLERVLCRVSSILLVNLQTLGFARLRLPLPIEVSRCWTLSEQCWSLIKNNGLLVRYIASQKILRCLLQILFLIFIKSILKSLVILAIWLALRGAIYSRIAPSFALNRIFFSCNENGIVKQNIQSDSKVINKISGKLKAESQCVKNFATAIAKTLLLIFSKNCVISKWI